MNSKKSNPHFRVIIALLLSVGLLLYATGVFAQDSQGISTLPAPGKSQELIGEIKLTFSNLKTTFSQVKADNTKNAEKVSQAIRNYESAKPEDKPAKNALTNEIVCKYTIDVVNNYNLLLAKITEAQEAASALTNLGTGESSEIEGFVEDLVTEIQPFLEVERQRMESISTMVANDCLFENPELERHYKNLEDDRKRIAEKINGLKSEITDNGVSDIAYDMGIMLNWLKEEVEINRYDQLLNLAKLGTKAYVDGHMAILKTVKPMLQELWDLGLAQILKDIEGPTGTSDQIDEWLDSGYEDPEMINPVYTPNYYPKYQGSTSLNQEAIRKANKKANLR